MGTNQKLSAVMSGLMGIVFGCSIVYVISRLIAAQRRIATLEQHITRKADDDVVVSLTTRVNEVMQGVCNISSDVKRTLTETNMAAPPNSPVPYADVKPPVVVVDAQKTVDLPDPDVTSAAEKTVELPMPDPDL